MAEKKKPDLVLSTGKEIFIDISKLTYRDYVYCFSASITDKRYNEIIAGVSGLAVDEMLDLLLNDQRKIVDAFFKKTREPMNDPNSESPPTSD